MEKLRQFARTVSSGPVVLGTWREKQNTFFLSSVLHQTKEFVAKRREMKLLSNTDSDVNKKKENKSEHRCCRSRHLRIGLIPVRSSLQRLSPYEMERNPKQGRYEKRGMNECEQ